MKKEEIVEEYLGIHDSGVPEVLFEVFSPLDSGVFDFADLKGNPKSKTRESEEILFEKKTSPISFYGRN